MVRQFGDIFCADPTTAGLVRQALNEKFGRERDAVNAFRVVLANLSRRQRYLFLYVGIANMQTGSVDTVSFTLEAPDERVQRDGQAKFDRFISALGLASVDDSDLLLGRTATFEGAGESRIFKRWPT